jgi:quercetin dioxygenase-like cupin family protein
MTGRDVPERPAVLVDALRDLPLDERQLSVYDRPVGMRTLHEDPASGAEHLLVRYPQGMRAQRHRHTAAHTIVVLEGALEANGQLLGAGSYAHFPGGTVMHHAPAEGHGCLFVILFDGPADVESAETSGG